MINEWVLIILIFNGNASMSESVEFGSKQLCEIAKTRVISGITDKVHRSSDYLIECVQKTSEKTKSVKFPKVSEKGDVLVGNIIMSQEQYKIWKEENING